MTRQVDIYLTSKNQVKKKVAEEFLNNLSNLDTVNNVKNKYKNIKFNLICVESESEIEGGQPYGCDETLLGCRNRTKQFVKGENYISIENGFVTENDIFQNDNNQQIYDIAVIIVNLDRNEYIEWSEKRQFPFKLTQLECIKERTIALEEHFVKNNDTRYDQLTNTMNKIKFK
jgi:non-canonical (house-cleaning) NTP pyrophosphatase